MSDLVGNPNCWFSQAQAHISSEPKYSDFCFAEVYFTLPLNMKLPVFINYTHKRYTISQLGIQKYENFGENMKFM